MARSLFLSIGLVMLLYVLVNLAYLKVLGFAGVAKSDAVAADLLAKVWGTAGEKLISVMIAIAANHVHKWFDHRRCALQLCPSVAIGSAGLSRALGRHDGTPRNAMLVQGAIALSLVVLGAILKGRVRGFGFCTLRLCSGGLPADGGIALRPAGEGAPGATCLSGCPDIRSCPRSSC